MLKADIDTSARAVRACYAAGGRTDRIAIGASEELGDEGDAALIFGLLPAMRLGLPIQVPREVSPRLLEGVGQVQRVFHRWDEGLEEVPIEAEPRLRSRPRGNRVGAFFSGGVDSFYTALVHRAEITDLIFIQGFDIPLSAPSELQQRAASTARETAEELGMNLVEVRADIRSFCDQYVHWEYYNGLALAAVALLLQRRFGTVHLPASMSLTGLYDRETPHPWIDPLLGTESMEIVSSGVEARRHEKIEYLADSDFAMSRLRVCWETPGGAYNCGACEKCLRTMISLQVAGALGKCRTLPDRLEPAQVRRMPLTSIAPRVFARENLRALESGGGNRRFARALRAAIRRSDREWRRKNRGLPGAGHR
jgi:hypothetical protein